jgi:hypothetical protein
MSTSYELHVASRVKKLTIAFEGLAATCLTDATCFTDASRAMKAGLGKR